jgi:DNA-directed RNA polymerase specialized sigma24 family protein
MSADPAPSSSAPSIPPTLQERLLAVLDPDPRRAEQRYAELWDQLVRFFEWKGCAAPEDFAQETLTRALTKISEGADVFAANPRSYFFGFARILVMEGWKRRREEPEDPSDCDQRPSTTFDALRIEQDVLWNEAMALLDDADRSFVCEYIRGDAGDRAALSRRLGITPGNLRVRYHRIVAKLKRQVGGGAGNRRAGGRSSS